MPELDVIFPEGAPDKWSWMISDEELDAEEIEEKKEKKKN